MRRAWTSWRSAWERVMDSVRRASSGRRWTRGRARRCGRRVRGGGAGRRVGCGGVAVRGRGERTASTSAAGRRQGGGWAPSRTWTERGRRRRGGGWSRRPSPTTPRRCTCQPARRGLPPAAGAGHAARDLDSSGVQGNSVDVGDGGVGRSEGEASTSTRIPPPARQRTRAAATARPPVQAPNTATVSGAGRLCGPGGSAGPGVAQLRGAQRTSASSPTSGWTARRSVRPRGAPAAEVRTSGLARRRSPRCRPIGPPGSGVHTGSPGPAGRLLSSGSGGGAGGGGAGRVVVIPPVATMSIGCRRGRRAHASSWRQGGARR